MQRRHGLSNPEKTQVRHSDEGVSNLSSIKCLPYQHGKQVVGSSSRVSVRNGAKIVWTDVKHCTPNGMQRCQTKVASWKNVRIMQKHRLDQYPE